MANNPGDAPSEDFFEQMLGFPGYSAAAEANLAGNSAPPAAMMLQLGSGDGSAHLGGIGIGIGGGYGVGGGFPLGLSLEQGKGGFHDASGSGKRFIRDDIIDSRISSVRAAQSFHGQPVGNTVPPMSHPPASRPRVRARRGQATDPHSIAERLRRERIAERIRALQELVPTFNKADKVAMVDEIVEYVKFLRLQVKVLSMSRLGGLVTEIPLSSVLEQGNGGWETWSNDGTEQQVVKLMEEDVGAAMQFLQSKALCIMPMSLASAMPLTQDSPTPAPNPSN